MWIILRTKRRTQKQMWIDNNYIKRNLIEQVHANQDDIQDFKDANQTIAEFGIYVQGVLSNISLLPEVGQNFGDAYLIGTSTPYDMRVWTRKDGGENGEWVDLGSFPLQGPRGEKGDVGSLITTGSGGPKFQPQTINDFYINVVNGDLYGAYEEEGRPLWKLVGNIKGPKGERGERGYQGIQGIQGEKGPVGPIGPQGIKGDKGDVGPAFNIQGTLTSTSQLPEPTAEMQDKGYCYRIPDASGVPHIWVVEGANEVGPFEWVDIGVAGIKGEDGAPGKGIDTLSNVNLTLGDTSVAYNTTDGMRITSTGRFTYVDGQKDTDVELTIPIKAGNGIVIDNPVNTNYIEVKAGSNPTFDSVTLNNTLTLGEDLTSGSDSIYTSVVESPSHQGDITFKFTYTGAETKLSELLKKTGIKKVFGRSLVGSGNINLFKHIIKGERNGCFWSTTFITTEKAQINQLSVLFKALGGYEFYPACGYYGGTNPGGVIWGFEPRQEGYIHYGYQGQDNTISWMDFGTWTITDQVQPI